MFSEIPHERQAQNRYMPFFDIMRFIISLFVLAILGCTSISQKTDDKVDTTKLPTEVDLTPHGDEKDVEFRDEFVSLYQRPILIDTFFSGDGVIYKVNLRHYSTMDSGLVIPAKYNFDINSDFVTHNFVSDLTVLAENDTVFQTHITKNLFRPILDTFDMPLKKYATLLYPTIRLDNDSIHVYYSISIPVTDNGIRASINFNKSGRFSISE